MAKVVVTDPSFSTVTDSFSLLRAAGHEVMRCPFPLTEEQMLPYLGDAAAVVAGVTPVGRPALEAAPALKVISRFGVGLDSVDVPEATRRRVIVTNAAGANADAVADFAFLLMMALSRNLCPVAALVRAGRWEPSRGVEVNGRTLGVIGTGQIGRRVIARAQGFGMKILANDVVQDPGLVQRGVRYVDIAELLSGSDYVSIHVPRMPATIGLIGARELALMKPTAYLINTARGGIVDEAALCNAIKARRIAGAGLDVFAQEPPGASELIGLDNVIATSHVASSTDEAMRNVDANCVENVLRVLSGREPLSPVNYPFK
jgi:D-3-phosphoglycerate dehydrogenase / 2-oxoglutarate reductase